MTPPVVILDPDQRRHRRHFVIGLVGLLLAAFLYTVAPILMGVVAGILLWVMTRRMYEELLKRVRGRQGLAAGLAIVATLLVVIVPLVIILTLMISDAATLGHEAQQWFGPLQPQIAQGIEHLTQGRSLYVFGFEITAAELRTRVAQISGQTGQYLLALVKRTASGVAQFTVLLFVALYTLYFFYLDGDKFIEWLKMTLPLDPLHSDKLIDSFLATSIATLKMLAVIGVVQGAVCGFAFWVVGAPGVIFLSVAATLSTLVPSFGPGLVIIPVAVGLFIAGKFWFGVGLLAWGAIVVGNIDNFLRPYLVHRAIAMHQLVIFLTSVGGILTFGFFGVLIGPVIGALLKASLDVYQDVFRGEPEPATVTVPETVAK
jgi:predicted PurR-regulated permease PerM